MPKAEERLRVADEHDDDGVHKKRTDWGKNKPEKQNRDLGNLKMRADFKKKKKKTADRLEVNIEGSSRR